ncbi:hypothetical protein D5366_07695 [Neokomagataea tanensis]|uniref:Uncharacterized protein n=1 Tax=Neokomagataea tanensis TaxID=661191 RepID=A0A4Y6V5A8_9PROT|nr:MULTISPECIES: hypothetical protein [Neokomagataea]QDH25113.1 hypothetical protein D5366_07695 [Neokomagataea tanensis]
MTLPPPRPELQKARPQASSNTGPIALCLLTVFALGGGFYAYTQGLLPASPAKMADTPKPLPAAAQLSMLSLNDAPKALAASHFDSATRAKIMASLQRGDIRLAQLPLLDAAGVPGQVVDVTSAGITQRVVLSASFQPVVLPITTAGAVSITPVTAPHNALLSIIALTALGPEALPTLTGLNQAIELGVIVQ